ncbi:FxSxx-COOH system tetratricopeptide repeat protein [Streptomyces abikoensis]|uniref:FxSxx-COOH system tetratricopeptide repeat protein n=1 Tax=Streptomyces abikoensis TaxID=97398 RepID=UPI0033C24914
MSASSGGVAIGVLHQERSAPPARPVRLSLSPPDFVGRDGLLAEIRTRFTLGGGPPRLVTLTGLGGMGKTSAAVEYAHRHLDDYGLVWQIAAEDQATASAGFADLARLLGVRSPVDHADPVAQAHAALAARTDRWLLLLDNVTDADCVRDLLPPAGPGDVLLTTRFGDWPGTVKIEVPVLDDDVAVDFLLARTGDGDSRAAAAIAEFLGALPLALAQAAAYVSTTGLSLGEYLLRLRARRSDLLRRGRLWGYAMSVASTWQLAFQRLRDDAPAAVALLRIAAHCAPESVPATLLFTAADDRLLADIDEVGGIAEQVEPLLVDDFAVEDAISALRRFSLVGRPSGGAVSVHRLVQAVTIDEIPEDERAGWRAVTAALVERALPDDPDRRDNWPRFARLLPHALAALELASPATRRTVAYLASSGNYHTARIVQQQIYADSSDRLGAEHMETLAARADLATWTGRGGDPIQARDLFDAVVSVLRRVVGDEHPATLSARTWLADWTGQAGNGRRARDLAVELLPVVRRVLGDEHPDTLQTWWDVGFWTGAAGNPAAARDLYDQFLPAMEVVNGAEYPHTLTARNQRARWVGEAGDPETARELSAELLPIFERVSGPEHQDVLWVRSNLAWWAGEAGDAAAARDCYAELLPICERAVGAEYLITLVVRANFAWWTGMAGDPAMARDLTAALLPDRRRLYGDEHPDTVKELANLAHWTGLAGDPDLARDLYAEVVEIRKRRDVPS